MRATGEQHCGRLIFIFGVPYIASNADEYLLGIAYAKLAIDRYKIHAARYGLAYRPIFRIMPLALRKMNRYREALEYMKNVIKDYPPLDDTGEIEDGSILGNIYRDMKDYPSAEKYFVKAVELSKRQGTKDFDPYMNLAQLYIESGQYAKARPYLNEVLKYPSGMIISNKRRHFSIYAFPCGLCNKGIISQPLKILASTGNRMIITYGCQKIRRKKNWKWNIRPKKRKMQLK